MRFPHIISIPPLNQRKEDIIDITTKYISSYEEKNSLKINIETPNRFYNALKSYTFPGNIRELFNIITTCIEQYNTDEVITLQFENLPVYVRDSYSELLILDTIVRKNRGNKTYQEIIERDIELNIDIQILKALHKCIKIDNRINFSRVAYAIDSKVNRMTISRKIKNRSLLEKLKNKDVLKLLNDAGMIQADIEKLKQEMILIIEKNENRKMKS